MTASLHLFPSRPALQDSDTADTWPWAKNVYCPRPVRKVPYKAICWTCGAAGLLAFWLAALWFVTLILEAMAGVVNDL